MPMSDEKKYWAFISYSSKDKRWGQWLHKRLENYPIPKEFQGTELGEGAVLGNRLRPVFRDRDELAGSAELGPAILRALRQSRYLVVLCSPNSARSEWVNKEIEDFKAITSVGRILALILEGEPNATSNPAVDDALECFPPALRYPTEPLAGDLRREGDGKERGFLKVLSGIAQLDFDALYRRHERSQRRRRSIIGSLSLAVIIVLVGLTLFAFRQKAEAQRQRAEATLQREEARSQRDAANRNLADMYFEKAERAYTDFSAGRGQALAWLLEAAKADRAILQRSEVQARADEWRGPWPLPDRLAPTGRVPDSTGVGDFLESLADRTWERVWVQRSDRSWSLLDSREGDTLASGLFPEEVGEAFSVPGGEVLLLRGREHLALLAWDDGRLVGSLATDGEGWITDAKLVGDRVIYAINTRGREQGQIMVWSWKEEARPVALGEPVDGELTQLAACQRDGEILLLGVVENEDVRSVCRFSWEEGSGQLTRAREPIGGGGVLWLDDDPQEFSRGLCWFVSNASEPSLGIHDLRRDTFHPVSLGPEQSVFGGFYDGNAPVVLVGSREDNALVLETIHTGDGSRSPVLPGAALSRAALHPDSGIILALCEKRQEFTVIRPDGSVTTIDPGLPLGTQLSCHDISFVDGGHAFLDGQTWPQGVDVSVVADLTGRKAPVVFATHDARQCLVIDGTEDAITSASVLSHRGGVLSFYDDLAPVAGIISGTGQKAWTLPAPAFWVSVDDSGSPAALCAREVDDETSIGYSQGGAPPTRWHEVGSLGNDPAETVRQESGDYLLFANWGSSLVLDKRDGTVVRLPERAAPASLHLAEVDEGAAVLFQEGTRLHLAELPGLEPLWSAQLGGALEDARVDAASGTVALLTTIRNSLSESVAFTLRLSQLTLRDGVPVSSWDWVADPEEARRITGTYDNQFSLISADPPAVDFQAGSGSELQRHRLLVPSSGRLEPVLEWSNSGYGMSVLALSDGSFVAGQCRPDEQFFALGHLRPGPEGWAMQTLVLDGPPRDFSASPDASRLVVLTENSRSLWDLASDQLMRARVRVPVDRFSQTNELGAGYSSLWPREGDKVFFWGKGLVSQFGAAGGNFERTLQTHRRDTQNLGYGEGISAVALSSDGRWLVSADSSGHLRRSRIDEPELGFEELRWATRAVGGYAISEAREPARWFPAGSTERPER